MEQWRDIPGWEGRYQASTLGRIRSIRRLKSGRTTIRVLRVGFKEGYQQVVLCRNGKKSNQLVHTLVALAYHGPCPASKHSIDHENRLPYDNRPSNLKYATRIEQEANKNPVGWSRIYEGFPGVTQLATGFRSVCFLGRREWRIGHFRELEDAVLAAKWHRAFRDRVLFFKMLLPDVLACFSDIRLAVVSAVLRERERERGRSENKLQWRLDTLVSRSTFPAAVLHHALTLALSDGDKRKLAAWADLIEQFTGPLF